MSQDFLIVIWILLSVGAANMAPMFSSRVPGIKSWNTPLDFNKKFRGKPIFGKNKTWRGLASGIIAATIVVILQQIVLTYLGENISVAGKDYTSYNPILLGSLLGAGALLGDAIESFFKRQMNIAPGKSWFPFDQIDYIIGAALLSYPVIPLSFMQYVLMIAAGFLLHLAATTIGYLLHLKENII